MFAARRDGYNIRNGVDGLNADHRQIFFVAKIGQLPSLLGPRVPNHGGLAAILGDPNTAIQRRVVDHAGRSGVEVHAVGLALNRHWPMLRFALEAFDLIKIIAAIKAIDHDSPRIADGEVGMQRATTYKRLLARITRDQLDPQLRADGDDELQPSSLPSRAKAKLPPSRPMVGAKPMLSKTNQWMLAVAVVIFLAAAIFAAVVAR